MERADLAIACCAADIAWAEWLAWTLERAGLHSSTQAYDLVDELAPQLERATHLAETTLLLISPRLLALDSLAAA